MFLLAKSANYTRR